MRCKHRDIPIAGRMIVKPVNGRIHYIKICKKCWIQMFDVSKDNWRKK